MTGTLAQTELNQQNWKMAAPGTGIIAFTRVDMRDGYAYDESCLRVLLSNRGIPGQEGLGITGGGHVECGDIDAMAVGSIVETASDAYRENTEENKGFARAISRKKFLERVQPISTFNVRSGDANRVHSCTYFGLYLPLLEYEKMSKLRPGDERKGPLIDTYLTYDVQKIVRDRPERFIALMSTQYKGHITQKSFYHQHELRAFGHLAWHAANRKLWQPS